MRSLFGFGTKLPDVVAVVHRMGSLRGIAAYAAMQPSREDSYARRRAMASAERDAFERNAEAKRDRFFANVRGDRLTPWEREFVRTTTSTMSDEQYEIALRRLESFAVLLWSLSLLDSLPPFDTPAHPDILASSAREACEPRLRSARERESARRIAEFWHWRCRTAVLAAENSLLPDKARKNGFTTYDDIVRLAARTARENGDLAIVDDDFLAFGKAFRDLDPAERGTVAAIAAERHYACNWLCGLAPGNRWDETRTDT